MNIEKELCSSLETVFKGLFPDLKVEGNWLADGSYLKGVEYGNTEKMEILVAPRKYETYTARIAEFAVTVNTTFSLASDADISRTVEAYELIVGKMERWHFDIEEVKRDLRISDERRTRFDPVGFRLDGGSFDIDRETKTRMLVQQFTVRGRIC